MPEDLVVRAVRAVLVVPENLVVQAVLAASVVREDPAVLAALVVPENLAVLAALAVPAELAVRVAPAALELDRVAVPRRTKSAIAVHHLGQVAVARVEDLRAAAETTRAQAAAEAATAWAVAG